MTLNKAKSILGDTRTELELTRMVRALSFARFLNDDEDDLRLEAAKVLLADKRKKRNASNKRLRS